MKRIMLAAVTVTASLAFAVPSFAAGKNPPTSCGVGNAVSVGTQEVGGIGRFFHEEGINAGEAIQSYHEFVKETC